MSADHAEGYRLSGATGPTELEVLLAERARSRRLGAPPMASLPELEEWLAGRQIALVSGKSALPSAAEAIAGAEIPGSWWGHPEGSVIFALLTGLENSDGWLDLVLVGAKRTIVAAELSPSVIALAADPERRERVRSRVGSDASSLLRLVEERGEVRPDEVDMPGRRLRAARASLEAALLARSVSEHTGSGRHISVVEPFPSRPHAKAGTPAPHAPLTVLLGAALASAGVAREGEVDKWFRLAEPDPSRRRDALGALGARRIGAGSDVYLSLAARS